MESSAIEGKQEKNEIYDSYLMTEDEEAKKDVDLIKVEVAAAVEKTEVNVHSDELSDDLLAGHEDEQIQHESGQSESEESSSLQEENQKEGKTDDSKNDIINNDDLWV